jgi:hypothetical protein
VWDEPTFEPLPCCFKNISLLMPSTKSAILQFAQAVKKLPLRQGGYFYLEIEASVINSLPKQKSTRLLCRIDDAAELRCGLNHLGNGNYFIIVASRYLKSLGKKEGDVLQAVIWEDTDPLGAPMPEVLQALLEQDDELNAVFAGMTDGKKRSLIYLISKIKNIDLQVQKATRFLTDVRHGASPFRKMK